MNKSSNTFVNFLVIGYAFVIILVALSAGIFFNYEQKISKSFQSYSQNVGYQANIDSLFRSAAQRSILMVRMLNAKDAFAIDDLQMDMNHYEHQISLGLIALEKHASADQMPLLSSVRKTMLVTRTYQNQVYSLLMGNKKKEALALLVDKAIQSQLDVQTILNKLQNNYRKNANHSQQEFASLISEMRNMILSVAMPIILSLLVIALLTIRKLKRFANAQQELLENLENIVHNRTQELLLDRQLMHNLNEAIGIFSQDNRLQITNKKLSKLLDTFNIPLQQTIWEILSTLFADLDLQDVQHQLLNHHGWRGEGKTNSDPSQFMMLDISSIQDPSLPEQYYSIILTDITELKNIQNQLEFTANFDAVTHLPNRYSFNKKVQTAIEENPDQTFHLFYLDLDDFKWVNDHLGHAAGDEFLMQVGKTFKNALPPNQFLARIGGDEFAILIDQPMDTKQLERMAIMLLGDLKGVNKGHHVEHEIGCSIGIASYPTHGYTAEALLKSADFAMYQAKKGGRNRYCLFSHKLSEELRYLHELEQNLRTAVKNKSFELHYQPQYSLHSLKLVGAEALIRWPLENKHIPPDEFIPLAEQFGLINEIGEFVFKTAINQLAKWNSCPTPLPRMAINASSIQLLAGNFGTFVEDQLKLNNINADRVDIEVTESVMMKNIEKNDSPDSTCLSFLQEKGLEISIDDFGTGYSSLSYIKHLNIDRIKIDKSFIDDIEFNREARSIVKAIIKMGHSLGLKVLAEGIETPNQLDILKQLDCDEGQGFLFSKPINAERFELKCLS
ncbi:EAL domain-containing protein [Hydrogenovibrio kuenenii]|uniref:EAL domain-containing protein n=1 Tax=Hydrogenovibrio kuenenii TaxID=63658 RepID=UPI00046690E2|nr:EAL domain-containing protein [Hydrogenovibrio kuenenii]